MSKYTVEKLNKYPYFEKLLEKEAISNILDSLTGLIARKPFELFIKTLIDEGTPFTLGMLDLDNFKSINDNYGHVAGDSILKDVAANMIAYFDDSGLVARFGGDEYLFLLLGERTYDEIHDMYADMFACEKIVRKSVRVNDITIFITATSGTASFPKDAKTYDDLFAKADKTLYRGKSKGRNCYIIYVEEKHGKIDIKKLASEDLYTIFYNLENKFVHARTLKDKIRNPILYIRDAKKIENVYYIDKDNYIYRAETFERRRNMGDMKALMGGEDVVWQNENEVDERFADFTKIMNEHNIYSYIIMKIRYKNTCYGYVMFADSRSTRMWQTDEKTVLFYYSKLFANYFEFEAKK